MMKRLSRLAPLVVSVGLLGLPSGSPFASASPSSLSLRQTLPVLKFDGVGLGDCVEFLRDVSGSNINVDWKALAEANVNKDTPVTVRLNGVSLRKALSVILNEAAGGDALTFSSEDNVIQITTKAIADKTMYVHVYPVDDLIVQVPNFTDAPNFDITGGSNSSGGGGNRPGASNNRSPFASSSTATAADTTKTKDQSAQELVDLVVATISPELWQQNGGTASVRYFNGSLVVSAPRSVHEALGGGFD